MLIKVKNKLLEKASSLFLRPKIYQNQSLFFEYVINSETLAISYNQKNHKIYFYFRNKQDISSFINMLDGLNYIKYNYQLICDVQNLDLDGIVNILFETLSRTVKYVDGLEITEDIYSSEKMADIEKGLINFNLAKCVDRNIVRKIVELKERRFESHDEYAKYLKYCCDVGALELILYTFEYMDKNSTVLKEFCAENKDIMRIKNFSNDSLILELQQVAFNQNLMSDELLCSKLWSYFNKINIEKVTSYQNMVLCFILTLLLHRYKKTLLWDQCLSLFNYFYSIKNMNSIRRDVCLLMIIEYCARNQLSQFFKLPQKWYNHTGKVLEKVVMNKVLDKISTQELWTLYHDQIKQNNILNFSKPKKIAVCISGMYRNHSESLRSIKEKLVDPLNADVFIHTWGKTSIWPGIGGNGNVDRFFGKEILQILPEKYRTFKELKKIFPSTYIVLQEVIVCDTDKKTFDILNPKKIEVEKEEDLIESLGDLTGYMHVRATPNQIKMFHGIKCSFDMALNSGEYDYIIRCRPDIQINNIASMNMIDNLENNILYTSISPGIGLGDAKFTLSASMAYDFSRFVNLMYIEKKLSPFYEFPFYDSHNLLGAWIHAQNYECQVKQIQHSLLVSPKISLPGLKAAVQADYENLSEMNKSKFTSFVEYLIKRNG